MINSRKLEDLHPYVAYLAEDLINLCRESGIDLLVTSTYRDMESQQQIYNQGRTPASKAKGEKIVTNARPGQSFHNYRCAFDVVPLVNSKAVWNDNTVWARIGQLGKEVGLEWAGDWKTFKEFPHFQYTGGLTLADFQSGKTLDDVLEVVEEEEVPTP